MVVACCCSFWTNLGELRRKVWINILIRLGIGPKMFQKKILVIVKGSYIRALNSSIKTVAVNFICG